VAIAVRQHKLTIADRSRLGDLDGWLYGWPKAWAPTTRTDTDQLYNEVAAEAKCRACGTVGMSWRAFNNGSEPRVLFVCPECGASVDV
jgi:hypothetical protein